jgi:hypothetical protein
MILGIVRRLYRVRPGPPDRDDLPTSPRNSLSKASTSFTPTQRFWQFNFDVNIFQTCQQINAEATSLFYGMNVFTFEAVPHLYAFLGHFAHRLPLVRQLGVASIATRTTYAHNLYDQNIMRPITSMTLINIFPLLTYATNLEVFYMNASIYQSFSSKADLAAKSFYDKAHWWLWAMILYKRDPLEILRMPKLKTKKGDNGQWVNKQWSTTKKGQNEFLAELAVRLVVPAFEV